jgi:hypothetical protein
MSQPKRTGRRHGRKAQKAKRLPPRSPESPAKWSAQVTRTSNALDLEPSVFTKASPAAIARSLKRSAEASGRRKAEPYRSAMSMLTFYINRAGKNLPKARLQVLERAKGELRKAFGRA